MRNKSIDVLKGVAIIAIILFHANIAQCGYLGVDIFLVIAGYFTALTVGRLRFTADGSKFILSRVFRLLPLLLLAGTLCLIFGWFMMLPDNYENVAESVIATNTFTNNFLQCLTTGNYWSISNEYRPLMHTWYLGLLMQLYLTVPLILLALKRFAGARFRPIAIATLSLIAIVSIILDFTRHDGPAQFYYLPYRLYEFCAGALIPFVFPKIDVRAGRNAILNASLILAYALILALLFVDAPFVHPQARLFAIILLTCFLIVALQTSPRAKNRLFSNPLLAIIGMACYSLFVWHQMLLAITRYSFTADILQPSVLAVLLASLALLSFLSYKYVEKMPRNKATWSAVILVFVAVTAFALHIYNTSGVVRDVPELDVRRADARKNMWGEYCDRGYAYDKDFADDGRRKVLVIGNSFARDFVNIIVESPVAKDVDLSYLTIAADDPQRVRQADIVFVAAYGITPEDVTAAQTHLSPRQKLYVVGEKNFGASGGGQIYRHRHAADYHTLTTTLAPGYLERNNALSARYPDNFIDLISLTTTADGRIRVFTPDGKYISQDGLHLTRSGARYLATLLDWPRLLTPQ